MFCLLKTTEIYVEHSLNNDKQSSPSRTVHTARIRKGDEVEGLLKLHVAAQLQDELEAPAARDLGLLLRPTGVLNSAQ
jgi:hypothetical protein